MSKERESRNALFFVMVGVITSTLISFTAGADVTLQHTGRGRYFNGGEAIPGGSILVGNGANPFTERRNWMAFDLSVVNQPITGATLRIFNGASFTADDTETYTLFDVITPVDDLLSGDFDVDIYLDLADGPVLGSIDIGTEQRQFVEIALNKSAIDQLNATDSLWAIGGAITTLDDDDMTIEFAFGGVADPTIELILTTIPAPPAFALLGLAMIAPIKRRRRRFQ